MYTHMIPAIHTLRVRWAILTFHYHHSLYGYHISTWHHYTELARRPGDLSSGSTDLPLSPFSLLTQHIYMASSTRRDAVVLTVGQCCSHCCSRLRAAYRSMLFSLLLCPCVASDGVSRCLNSLSHCCCARAWLPMGFLAVSIICVLRVSHCCCSLSMVSRSCCALSMVSRSCCFRYGFDNDEDC